MNEFGSEAKDDHEMILHNLELYMEDWMDWMVILSNQGGSANANWFFRNGINNC